jgi:hypothetical protein
VLESLEASPCAFDLPADGLSVQGSQVLLLHGTGQFQSGLAHFEALSLERPDDSRA